MKFAGAKRWFAGAVMAIWAGGASAVPMAIDFTAQDTGSGISGFGTALTDSANLAPNSSTYDLADLISLSLTLTGISGTPSTSTFMKSDLDSWRLDVNVNGTIVDLNFFMAPYVTNADGYSINGDDVFSTVVYQGPTSSQTPLGSVHLRIDAVQEAALPVPSTIALMGLGVVGFGYRRRRNNGA